MNLPYIPGKILYWWCPNLNVVRGSVIVAVYVTTNGSTSYRMADGAQITEYDRPTDNLMAKLSEHDIHLRTNEL